eukprot:5088411-Amphidinium_carterae.1
MGYDRVLPDRGIHAKRMSSDKGANPGQAQIQNGQKLHTNPNFEDFVGRDDTSQVFPSYGARQDTKNL